jgi:hypothetical protein
MDQIIQSLAQRLNLPESTIRSALGVLLRYLKSHVGEERFQELQKSIPGLAGVTSSAPESESSPGGDLLGGLLQKAGTMFGGEQGGAAELLGSLQKAGLPLQKAAPFASGFLEEARGAVGSETVDKILDSVPGLKAALASGSHADQ